MYFVDLICLVYISCTYMIMMQLPGVDNTLMSCLEENLGGERTRSERPDDRPP